MPTSRVKTNLFLTFEITAKCVLHTTILQADSLNRPIIKFNEIFIMLISETRETLPHQIFCSKARLHRGIQLSQQEAHRNHNLDS